MEAAEPSGLQGEPTQCEKVGEAMPDIAGFGVLLGLSVQAFISISLSIWVFFWTKLGRLDVKHPEGTAEHESTKKRLGFLSSILMVGNDLQMITGIALIITALAHGHAIDLYHTRLVFETVSFVGISNAAALVCYTFTNTKAPKDRLHRFMPAHWTPRFRVSYLFAVLFLALTIFLEIRLDEWSLTAEEPGFCYVTTGLSMSSAGHPVSDKGYVATTAIWLLLVMLGALFCSAKFRRPLLILSGLQFPLHLYMMIKLRIENQPYLEGESENAWDFGQTTATILLGLAIGQLVHEGVAYLKFENGLKKYGPQYALFPDDRDPESGTLLEEGFRAIQEVKRGIDNTRDTRDARVGRASDVERHGESSESHELTRTPESTPENRA